MKDRQHLIVSLSLNVAFGATLFFLWIHANAVSALSEQRTKAAPETIVSTSSTPQPIAPATPGSQFHWSAIESSDYREYVSNLKAIQCPDHTIRDIIVADIDDLYAAKTGSAGTPAPPWQNADRRRAGDRDRIARLAALRAEKRALVKALIGYEWDNHVSEQWHQDFMTGLALGYLPDLKPLQVMAIAGDYLEQASYLKAAANYILIDADRAQLNQFYDSLISEVSQLLTPAELEELKLRVQAAGFLAAQNINFEDIGLTGAEMREFVRLSLSFQDTFKDGFLQSPPLSEAESDQRKATFEQQLAKLLGSRRFADYQRAQDPGFRESCAFAQQHRLGREAATGVFNCRRAAEEKAALLKVDTSLSPDERSTALASLKEAATSQIKSALGDAYDDYLSGPGHWLENLAPVAGVGEQQP